MIDLTDERGGFFQTADGQVVSNTPDSPAAEILAQGVDGWRHVPFGSLGHALAFTDAAETLKEGLTAIGLWGRTLLLAPRWASTCADGTATNPSFKMTAEVANETFDEYLELLETLGWSIVRPGIERPLSAPNHKWGAAPFHYTPEYYDSLWTATKRRLGSLR